MYQPISKRIKVLFIGPEKNGKSSILSTYNNKDFPSETIGVDYHGFLEERVNYEIWDTSGQKRFDKIIPIYFKCVNKIVIVIDINQPFEKIIDDYEIWDNKIKENSNVLSNDLTKYLVFTKIDLINKATLILYKNLLLNHNFKDVSKENICFLDANKKKQVKKFFNLHIIVKEFKEDNITNNNEIKQYRCCNIL